MLRRWIVRGPASGERAGGDRSVERHAPLGKLEFLRSLPVGQVQRQPGTGVFVSPWGFVDARAFVRFLALEKCLPERVVLVTWEVQPVPRICPRDQAELTHWGDNIFLASIRFGFDDDLDIPRALEVVPSLQPHASSARFYVTPEHAHLPLQRMPAWQRWLFAMLCRLCVPAAEFFRLPGDRVTEIAGDE